MGNSYKGLEYNVKVVPRKFVLIGIFTCFYLERINMNDIIYNLLFFIIVFLVVFIFCNFVGPFINVKKSKKKKKNKEYKDQEDFKYTNECKLMIIRYNLDEKKVDMKKLLMWTSLCNAFVISLTSTIICNIPLKMYFQLAIGFIILILLVYATFEIVGKQLNKKWGKKNGK